MTASNVADEIRVRVKREGKKISAPLPFSSAPLFPDAGSASGDADADAGRSANFYIEKRLLFRSSFQRDRDGDGDGDGDRPIRHFRANRRAAP